MCAVYFANIVIYRLFYLSILQKVNEKFSVNIILSSKIKRKRLGENLFGYIEPDKSQLRLWEYEQYRAVYCGLCRSMGRHTGALSRLTLNYDYVFLAMIRCALLGLTPQIRPSRCVLHPTRKRAIALDDEALEYCSELGVILAHNKVLDDIADSRGAKKLFAMMLAIPTSHIAKKCKKTYECADKVAALLKELSELEKSEDVTSDMAAEVFGQILGEVFSFGLSDNASSRIAYEIGRHTGRYIYLADALDDYESDAKSGEFNPFVSEYGKSGLADVRERIKNSVLLELRELEAAIALVDFSTCVGYGNVVNNIIYLGMPKKIDLIFDKMKAEAKSSAG